MHRDTTLNTTAIIAFIMKILRCLVQQSSRTERKKFVSKSFHSFFISSSTHTHLYPSEYLGYETSLEFHREPDIVLFDLEAAEPIDRISEVHSEVDESHNEVDGSENPPKTRKNFPETFIWESFDEYARFHPLKLLAHV
jgi:hypothetical protein